MHYKLSDKLAARLTAAQIERQLAREQGRDPSTETKLRRDAFDGVCRGLHLRVSDPGGGGEPVRSWGYFFRFAGKAGRLTLGRFPALGVAEARRKAGEVALAVQEGKNPALLAAARQAAQARAAADTVEALFEVHISGLKRKGRTPGYVRDLESAFANWIAPAIGSRPIHGIGRRELVELIEAISGGNSRRMGGAIMANRVAVLLTGFWRACVDRGVLDTSPAERLPRQCDEVKRERVLDDSEIAAFWRATNALAYPWGVYAQTLLLTGAQRNEIGEMQLSELRLEQTFWQLPGSRSKNGKSHTIHLAPATAALLASAVEKAKLVASVADPFVFSVGRRGLSGFSHFKACLDRQLAEVCQAAGQPPLAPWHLHDLRRTFASGCGQLGLSDKVIAACLNHTDSSVTAIYNLYDYAAEKRTAWMAWAAHLSELVGPGRCFA